MAGLLMGLTAGCSGADPTAAPQPDPAVVTEAITEESLRARLEELADAAEGSGAFRSGGSSGYDRSAALVERELADAGWSVQSDRYEDTSFVDDRRSSLAVSGGVFGSGDVLPLMFAPGGEVTGPVLVASSRSPSRRRLATCCAPPCSIREA